MSNKKEYTKLGDAIRQAGHVLDHLGEKAAKKSDALLQQSKDTLGKLNKTLHKQSEPIVTYVKKHPLRSMLTAGFVGAFLGKIFRRRK